MLLRNIRVLSLDATNTLIRLQKPPAETYADFAKDFGFYDVDQKHISDSFVKAFKELEIQQPCYGFYESKAKVWWTDLLTICYGPAIAGSPNFDALTNQVFEFYRTKKAWSLTNEKVFVILLYNIANFIVKNLDFLRSCKSRGLKLAVVSNFDYRLHELLDLFGITEFIDHILISGDIGFQKPDPPIFRLLFEHFQIDDPSCYAHIGDNYKKDYLPARELGMHAFLLTDHHPDVHSTHCIRNITELKFE